MGNLFDISGRVAIVTGGRQGLGQAMVGILSKAGAHVVIADLAAEGTDAVTTSPGPGEVVALKTDVTKAEQVEQLVGRTVERFGRLDILVNNAGIITRNPALETDETEWDSALDVNLKGVWLCCRAAGRQMISQGRGRIINISTTSSVRGGGNKVVYGASKAGVNQLTRALAVEWAIYGVTINAIAPGVMINERTQALFAAQPQLYQDLLARVPMGRPGQMDDLTGTLLYLASDAASYVTGQVIFLDGGLCLA